MHLLHKQGLLTGEPVMTVLGAGRLNRLEPRYPGGSAGVATSLDEAIMHVRGPRTVAPSLCSIGSNGRDSLPGSG